MKENKKLVNEIISDVKHDMSNEDIISLLADSRISANPDKEKYTFGQRAADKIAKFAGSWAFIFSFSALLILWMVGNVILAKRAFDPYPFILLNLVLSCVAALQAPLIMMSQNRQEERPPPRRERLQSQSQNRDNDRRYPRQDEPYTRPSGNTDEADEDRRKHDEADNARKTGGDVRRGVQSREEQNEHSEHKEPEEKPES